jgi:hypothetical protein
MDEIEFRAVAAYRCPGCERTIVLRPCPACEARRQFPVRPGLTADALLVSAGHQATVLQASAERMSRRDDP